MKHAIKVVLIEEDSTWREIYKRLFVQHKMSFAIVEDRADAVSVIASLVDETGEGPDLILLDIIVNAKDLVGISILKELKSNPATSRFPVVLLSADFLERGKDQALELGATAYLSKNLQVLMELLERLKQGAL
jgi:CheY-like chemotaxis protein